MLLIVIFSIALIPLSKCSKILACVSTPSYSHQVAFHDLWKELSLRGHQVTVLTTNPISDPKLTNLTEIDLSWLYNYFKNSSGIMSTSKSPWDYPEEVKLIFMDVSPQIFLHPVVQDLMKGKGEFDVVLIEHLIPELLYLGNIYNCPKIVITSTEIDNVYHQIMGNPTHPVSHPHFYLPYHGLMDFSERLLSSVYYCYVWYFGRFNEGPLHEENMMKYFNISTTTNELLSNIDLVFLNSHPVIHGARALSPATIPISYYRKSKEKPLQKDLKEFMDNAKNGFIYFSLGSNVKSSEVEDNFLQTIIDTLKELPYKIVYKYESDVMPGKPNNMMVVRWAPQRQILEHPNIKLFVTQGGRQSTEEAVYASVPMVIIPFFYDQPQNARMMKHRGVALIVERPVKKNELSTAIKEVISNPRYRTAMKELRKLALDVPMTGLENAIWWTEYAIRNKGAMQLRNPMADLPIYQFLLLDVIGFFMFTSIFLSLLIYFVAKLLFGRFGIIRKFKKD